MKRDKNMSTDYTETKSNVGKRLCCLIMDPENPDDSQCPQDAEWIIVFGNTPDDYTEACTDHVGALLADVEEQTIHPIKIK
jgi:hypothetical protein